MGKEEDDCRLLPRLLFLCTYPILSSPAAAAVVVATAAAAAAAAHLISTGALPMINKLSSFHWGVLQILSFSSSSETFGTETFH